MKPNIMPKPFLILILGLGGILYLVLLAGSIYEAIVFPRTPQKITLAQAVEMDLQNQPAFLVFDQTLYVSITDPLWECASIKQTGYKALQDRRRTDAVFSDGKRTAVVFIQLDGFYTCQELNELEIVGELQMVDTRPIEYQSDTTGNTVIGGDSGVLVYYFCTHCTPSSATFIPVIGMFLPLLIGWKIFRRHEKTGEQQ